MAVINSNTSGGATTISTSAAITSTSTNPYWVYTPYTPNEPVKTKQDYINEFFYRCESDDRLVLILEKVKDKKLTPNEALDILKGIKHFKIDGVQTDT